MINKMNKIKFIKKSNPLIFNGIAHRGLHNKDCTENGMPAFKEAVKNNVAIELDVHLTKDNRLLVCHDSDLERTTGKKGIIEELTLEEIQSKYELLDKSKIPSLQEVISFVQERVPIVIELKTYKKNNKPLAKALYSELKDKIINPSNYMIIAFDPRALFPLKKLGLLRVLLVAEERYDVFFFRHFFDGVDIEDKLLTKKKVLRYIDKHFTNVWTIEKKEEIELLPPSVDTITFQHLKPSEVEKHLNNIHTNLNNIKKEISYGAVVYKKEKEEILYLVEHMSLGHTSLCKGHIEKGETPYQCVLREIKEETNQDVEIEGNFNVKISYQPIKDVYKDVVFFISQVKGNNLLKDIKGSEINKSEFLPYEQAVKSLTHSTDKKVLSLANKYLKKNI